MYREAARAWQKAVPLNPGQANRARYCARLALAAHRLKGLLETAPEGKAWSALTRDEFEQLLKAQAATVREIQVEFAQTEELSEDRRAEMEQILIETRKLFVSAGLEFALEEIRERLARVEKTLRRPE